MPELEKIVGATAAPAASVAGSIINYFSQKRENRLNREFAAQQNDLAYQRQLEMIENQRAYDTPKAQMQRLLEAGLNPNLMYDSVSQSPLQAMNVPNGATAASNQTSPMVDPLSLSQSILNMANARKANKDSQLSIAKTKEILGDTPYAKANIASINAYTNTLVQQYNLNRLNELQVKIQYDSATDENEYSVSVVAPDGSESTLTSSTAADFRNSCRLAIIDNFRLLHSQADISEAEADNAVLYFYARANGELEKANSIKLENQDLLLFLNYAAEYYKSLTDEQIAIAAMAQDDYNFVSKFGGREAFRAKVGLVGDFIDIGKGILFKRIPVKKSVVKSKSKK